MIKINKLLYLHLLGLFFIPQAYAEWVDISPRVEITQSSQAFDRINKVLFSYITVTNTSAQTLAEPIRLVINNPSIPVLNASGTNDAGESYLQIADGLAAGAKTTVRVDFQLLRAKLVFATQIMQDIIPADLQQLSYEFVELRGRDGHQGLFPLYSGPTAGDAKLHTINTKDVKQLTISVVTDFGHSEFVAVIGDTSATDTNEWYTDIVLPSTPFTLRFEMKSAFGEILTTESDTISPLSFSLSLSLTEGHSFSPGDNTVLLTIKNKSNFDDSYQVLVNGSESYLASPLVSTSIDVSGNSTESVLIPVVIPKTINLHTLTLTAEVNENSTGALEEASIDILIMDEPLILSELDSKAVINPGSCNPIDHNQQTVDIMIAGSSHLDVNNIDVDTLIIIGTDNHISPINSQLIDIGTAANKACDQQQADRKTDLILTFSLADILAKEDEAEPDSVYVSILYFTITGMRYTHNATLVFP